MNLKGKIVEESRKVDEKLARVTPLNIKSYEITFPVPTNHPRYKEIKSYQLMQRQITRLDCIDAHIIADAAVAQQSFVKNIFSSNKTTILNSDEACVKNKNYLDSILHHFKDDHVIMGIGGGLMCNVTSYIVEQLQADLILVPTTVLSMADSSGGKVRLNQEINGRFYKHYVKSFYEPNNMILDDRFLKSLPEKQVSIGMVEIIKHGLFQSENLLTYLISESKKVLNKELYYLKKAILWAADLKRVCLEIDPEEQDYGSRGILRAGHDISDRLEEDNSLKIPHGLAVAYGIVTFFETKQEKNKLNLAKKVFEAYNIPYEKEDFMKFFK